MTKFFIVLSCLVAFSSAGFAPISYNFQEPSISSQSSNILRSPGNLQQISSYSKTVDTPFSSSSKSDIRVSNPGVYQTLSYAAPAQLHYAAPAPAQLHYAAPAPAQLHYAAPAAVAPAHLHYAAPAAVAPAQLHYAAPAAVAPAHLHYAAPAPVAAAPVVAHATFSGLGYSYAW